MKIYFENFTQQDEEGNGIGQSSYAEFAGTLSCEPDSEMWEALKQWAKRLNFTDVTSSEDTQEGVKNDTDPEC